MGLCLVLDEPVRQCDPNWSVVARFFSPAKVRIYSRRLQSANRRRVEQQKIHAKAGVAAEGAAIVPVGVHDLVRMEETRSIRPLLI